MSSKKYQGCISEINSLNDLSNIWSLVKSKDYEIISKTYTSSEMFTSNVQFYFGIIQI